MTPADSISHLVCRLLLSYISLKIRLFAGVFLTGQLLDSITDLYETLRYLLEQNVELIRLQESRYQLLP